MPIQRRDGKSHTVSDKLSHDSQPTAAASSEPISSKWTTLITTNINDAAIEDINRALSKYAEAYQNEKHTKEQLAAIIKACDQYIEKIPRHERRQPGSEYANRSLSEKYPHLLQVIHIQKEAVKRLFLPKEKKDVAARIKLLRKLVSPTTKGKRLDEPFWQEFRYGGKKSIADWMNNEGYTNREYFLSFGEIRENEKEQRGILISDIKYENDASVNQVSFEGGLLYFRNQLLNTKEAHSAMHNLSGEVLFVADTNQSVYVSDPHEILAGDIRHSSFLAGNKVLCAGTLKVEEGEIKKITLQSGHYKPGRKELLNFLVLLQKNHIDLSKILIEGLDGQIYNAQHFLDMKGFAMPVSKGQMVFTWAMQAKRALDMMEPQDDPQRYSKELQEFHAHLDKAAELGHIKAKFFRACLQVSNKFGYHNEAEGYKNLKIIYKAHSDFRPDIDRFLAAHQKPTLNQFEEVRAMIVDIINRFKESSRSPLSRGMVKKAVAIEQALRRLESQMDTTSITNLTELLRLRVNNQSSLYEALNLQRLAWKKGTSASLQMVLDKIESFDPPAEKPRQRK